MVKKENAKRHTKVLKLHILKPADDMSWKELGNILRDVRYRVFRLANLVISENYLNFHEYRKNPDNDIKSRTISQLSKELRKMFEEEDKKRKVKSNFEHNRFSKEGTLSSNVVYALSQYKLKAVTGTGKWGEVIRGKSSLPTFRLDMAIPVRCDDLPSKKSRRRMEKTEDGGVEVNLMICLKPYPRVVIATARNSLGDSQRVILERILENTSQSETGYRQRCFEIKQENRTKKWHLLVTYDFPVTESDARLSKKRIVGVDVGVSCPIYAAINNGHARLGRREFSALSARMRSLQGRTMKRRREIQSGGRISISAKTARSGHGRKRKLLPIENLNGRINNAYKTLNHQLSASIIKFALNHGAGVIQMENLEGLKDVLSGTFIGERWRYEELQRFITYKAAEAGIEAKKVNPKYTSRRCSKCGYIHLEFTRKFRDKNGKNGKSTRFICPKCEYKADSDYNAARNIATFDIENIIQKQLKEQKIQEDEL